MCISVIRITTWTSQVRGSLLHAPFCRLQSEWISCPGRLRSRFEHSSVLEVRTKADNWEAWHRKDKISTCDPAKEFGR